MNGEDQGLRFFELAAANPLLGQISEPALKSLMTYGALVEVGAGEHLIRQGAQSDAAYLLVDGEVDVVIENSYESVHLTLLSTGAILGEIGVFTGLPRNASVIARGSIRALRFARDDILMAGYGSPPFLRSIMGALGQSIYHYNNALGFFTNALAAIEQRNFDPVLLNDLMYPIPELIKFSQAFRRIAEQIIQRQARNREMDSAAAIQRAMLPKLEPRDFAEGELDIFADMIPAREVGGDLYDVVKLDQNRVAITIGDVCGKGVPASLFMAITQTVMRLVVRASEDLRAEVGAANDLIVANNREEMFTTLFCGVIDAPSGTVTYCNCGHNPPLVLRRGQGTFEPLRACGPPLGIMGGMTYKPREIALAPGDMLLLYTDGVTEAENWETAQFGMERLEAAVLATLGEPARRVVEEVIARVTAFAGGAPQSDDITCLAVVRGGVGAGERG